MKYPTFILSVITAAVLGTAAIAQERPAPAEPPRIATMTMGVPLPLPPPVDVELREQPDSPIHLTMDTGLKVRMPGTPLKVRNDSASTVAAFVLRIDVEPYGQNQMVVLGQKGLPVGESRFQGLSIPPGREGTPKAVVSVDYVQFIDGRSWGEDTLGRSKNVAAYLQGRSLAVTRIREALAGRDGTDIDRVLDTFGSAGFAEPNLPAGRAPRYVDYTARGYEEVINILQRMPRNSELGLELARKLEAMPLTKGQ